MDAKPNKHIPQEEFIYLIELLKFNFGVAGQPTIVPASLANDYRKAF